MPRFTIRVELHGAEDESDVYNELHAAMKTRNFSRTILFGKVRYELPSAEYSRAGDKLSGEQVLEDAKSAASEVWEDFSVFITETEKPRLRWNLKKAK